MVFVLSLFWKGRGRLLFHKRNLIAFLFQETNGFKSRILFLKLLGIIFCGQNGIDFGIEESHIPTQKS